MTVVYRGRYRPFWKWSRTNSLKKDAMQKSYRESWIGQSAGQKLQKCIDRTSDVYHLTNVWTFTGCGCAYRSCSGKAVRSKR